MLNEVKRYSKEKPKRFIVYAALVIFTIALLITLIVIVVVLVKKQESFSNQQNQGAGVLLSKICDDRAGQEGCGGAAPKFVGAKSRFLSTRGAGPRYVGSNRDVQDYYAGEVGGR